jgi:hypothetical protein
MDGLLGVAGMIITSDEMDHSLIFCQVELSFIIF